MIQLTTAEFIALGVFALLGTALGAREVCRFFRSWLAFMDPPWPGYHPPLWPPRGHQPKSGADSDEYEPPRSGSGALRPRPICPYYVDPPEERERSTTTSIRPPPPPPPPEGPPTRLLGEGEDPRKPKPPPGRHLREGEDPRKAERRRRARS